MLQKIANEEWISEAFAHEQEKSEWRPLRSTCCMIDRQCRTSVHLLCRSLSRAPKWPNCPLEGPPPLGGPVHEATALPSLPSPSVSPPPLNLPCSSCDALGGSLGLAGGGAQGYEGGGGGPSNRHFGPDPLFQNTVQGRVRAKVAKFGKNRVFTILAALVSLWLGMQRLCA